MVTGEVLSSDDSIENADSIGTAVSLRQDDNKTVKSNITIERNGISKFSKFIILVTFIIEVIDLYDILNGMSTTTNSLLFCLLITFNITLEILPKCWELLVRILKNTFPSQQGNAIQAYELVIFTELGIINQKPGELIL